MTYSTVWFGFWVADEFKPGVDTLLSSLGAKTRIAQTLGLTHSQVSHPSSIPRFPLPIRSRAPGPTPFSSMNPGLVRH